MNNEYEQGWMKLVDFMFKNPLPKMEMRWEDEERGSWGLEEMRKEFKERLYAKPCEKCGGKGYWEDAIGPLLCGKWEEVYKDGVLIDMKFAPSDHAKLPPKTMNVGRLSETGKGITNKIYGEPSPPLRYEPVPVYCPSCNAEKEVTPATHTWPRCDDCDEPMRREHEMPENQKV